MKCKKPPVGLTPTVVSGTSVTLANAAVTPAPSFGECFVVFVAGALLPLTGKEELIVTIGDVTAPVIDNCGVYMVSDQLRCRHFEGCEIDNPCYVIQLGLQGTEPVWFGRRGFSKRRTFLDVVTPPTP